MLLSDNVINIISLTRLTTEIAKYKPLICYLLSLKLLKIVLSNEKWGNAIFDFIICTCTCR